MWTTAVEGLSRWGLGFKETTYLRSHGEKRLKRRDGGGGVKGKEKISRE